jgi:hypothetical protein
MSPVVIAAVVVVALTALRLVDLYNVGRAAQPSPLVLGLLYESWRPGDARTRVRAVRVR